MNKRGNELAVLGVVLAVAALGLLFVLWQPPSTILPKPGPIPVPIVQQSAPQTQNQQHTTAPQTPSGAFGVPFAKEYGGGIQGIAGDSRAFIGRAGEQITQNCYTCSCLTDGITSVDRATADRVCADNCAGTITADKVGPCS